MHLDLLKNFSISIIAPGGLNQIKHIKDLVQYLTLSVKNIHPGTA